MGILDPPKGFQNGSTKLCCAQHVLLMGFQNIPKQWSDMYQDDIPNQYICIFPFINFYNVSHCSNADSHGL